MAHHGFPSLKNWVAGHYNGGNSVIGGDGGRLGSSSIGAMGYGDFHSLSLSMSPGSQSSCVTAPQHLSYTGDSDCMALDVSKKRAVGKGVQKQPAHRKSIDTFGQRTSQYRGVTRHRWTGRYEAHLWDNSCKRKVKPEKEGKLENYQEEMEEMKNMTRQEYVAHLRRKSSGFSRGASIYRGVTRHHQHGRWQARIGRVAGNKDLYLGTFGTQEEAAEAYDIAAIKFRGVNAVTNFDITRYDVDKIISSNTLLSSELARKKKAVVEDNNGTAPNQNYGREMDLTEDNSSCGSDWKMVLYQSPQHHDSVPDEKPMLLHGLFGVEAVHLSQRCDESSLEESIRPSNPASLMNNSSRSKEGSPDRAGLAVLYPKATTKVVGSNPWPAIPMAGMPMFAAWSDA
ncbi:hypothetical protein HPP92_006031 [Vanilla planifolia]|uniref:AP2/ERF domain-containing protein n=1 Tax=Vanilla planifolia TaxID=51239 RepID=A0A835RV26_VANPL|nr:hypothetical protein HPP92_006031 [Vanilla planifolia]